MNEIEITFKKLCIKGQRLQLRNIFYATLELLQFLKSNR